MMKCEKCGLMIVQYYDYTIGFENIINGKRKMLKEYPRCNIGNHNFKEELLK